MKTSLSKRLSFILVAMILVSTVIVAVFSYTLYRAETIHLSGERALSAARTVAAAVDPSGLVQAMSEQKKDAQWTRVKAFADKAATDNDLKYLYILDANYDDAFTYYAEGWNPETGDAPLDFLYREDTGIHDENIYTTIEDGVAMLTPSYFHEDFGWVVTGYAPILDTGGRAVGVVGADVAIEEVMAHINTFGLQLILIVAAFSVLFALLSITYINRKIGRPVAGLTASAEKLSVGDLNLAAAYDSDDEIGRLFLAFAQITGSTKSQIDIMNQIADGDLSIKITPRSPEDSMSIAIGRMVEKLTEMIISFQASSDHFAVTSVQIADEAKGLADSVAHQLAAIQTLSGSVAMITEKTKINAQTAESAALLYDGMNSRAKSGTEQMQNMVAAVGQINDACLAINRVTSTIESIAFQTNILSLNAAVEAARAGQSGKGFGVVADEVRMLAAKSAGSAHETAELIANSLEKSALGVQIATDTYNQLGLIMDSIRESVEYIQNISASSAEQSREIAAINASLDQVTRIVNQTARSARESADAGEKLSRQADQLNKLLRAFTYN